MDAWTAHQVTSTSQSVKQQVGMLIVDPQEICTFSLHHHHFNNHFVCVMISICDRLCENQPCSHLVVIRETRF